MKAPNTVQSTICPEQRFVGSNQKSLSHATVWIGQLCCGIYEILSYCKFREFGLTMIAGSLARKNPKAKRAWFSPLS
jgi:hypothetical protein